MPTYLGKLTSYMSQDDRSAKKKSYNVTVTQLEGQTCYQLDLFAKWTCICEICFSNFLPILILAGDCFWQLDLSEKWSCICESKVFLILCQSSFRRGGILTNWICSQSNHVFAVDGFLISFLSSLGKIAGMLLKRPTWSSYCLHQSSPFDLKVWQIFRRHSFSLDRN